MYAPELSTPRTSYELSERDRAVVALVSRLNQVSSSHLKTLLFDDVNRISLDRCLRRLTRGKYLTRVGKRAVGHRGGTPPAVYRLGPKGHWLLELTGRYRATVTVSEHSLKVTDIFVALMELERQGDIRLLPGTNTEQAIGHSRADLYLDYELNQARKRRKFYVEVQLNARGDIIRRKVEAYWDSFISTSEPVFPFVAFVVWDSWHEHEIRKLIPDKAHKLFKVYLPHEFMEAVTAEGL